MSLQNPRRLGRAGCIVLLSLPLAGCFDLSQKLTLDRSGAGRYEIAITAQGLLGEAIRDKHGALADLRHNNVVTRTVEKNGSVTQLATMNFRSLSDLKLSDEAVSLTNHGASWFGLGPSHVSFRRTLLVDRARRENAPRSGAGDERFGTELAQTMFGDHTYVFSVTLPGSVDRALPLHIGRTTVTPEVAGNYWGHTVTWRMPLYTMLQAKLLRFEVDFSAYGSFPDAQSLPE